MIDIDAIFEGITKAFIVILVLIASILFVAIWGLVWAIPLTWAWNFVVPDVFGLPRLSYLQMLAIYVILTSLWKSNFSISK